MCEAVGLEVARLKRLAVGPVRLGMLKPGTYRELTVEEVEQLRRWPNGELQLRRKDAAESEEDMLYIRPYRSGDNFPQFEGGLREGSFIILRWQARI